MATRLTFGTATLDSTEILKFSWKRSFKINTVGTVALIEITNPGNLTPIELNIDVTIRYQATQKFTLWTNLLTAKTLDSLTFLNRSLGNFYLTDLQIDSADLDNFGDVLSFDASLSFLGNQNYQ